MLHCLFVFAFLPTVDSNTVIPSSSNQIVSLSSIEIVVLSAIVALQIGFGIMSCILCYLTRDALKPVQPGELQSLWFSFPSSDTSVRDLVVTCYKMERAATLFFVAVILAVFCAPFFGLAPYVIWAILMDSIAVFWIYRSKQYRQRAIDMCKSENPP